MKSKPVFLAGEANPRLLFYLKNANLASVVPQPFTPAPNRPHFWKEQNGFLLWRTGALGMQPTAAINALNSAGVTTSVATIPALVNDSANIVRSMTITVVGNTFLHTGVPVLTVSIPSVGPNTADIVIFGWDLDPFS